MEVIVVQLETYFDDNLTNVVRSAVYEHYCYQDQRVYEIILDDPHEDASKFASADDYRPEFLIITLKPGRTVDDIPADYQPNIGQIIKIEKPS